MSPLEVGTFSLKCAMAGVVKARKRHARDVMNCMLTKEREYQYTIEI